MIRIEDNEIVCVWYCECCDDVIEVNPDFYQDNGTPVCMECDEDMLYSHTEVDCG